MKIIEFTGLPGCGKSTVIDMAVTEKEHQYILRDQLLSEVIPRKWIKQHIILFCLRVVLTLYSFQCMMPKKRKYSARLENLLKHLYYYKSKHNDKLLILEEGIVQYITSFAYDTVLRDDFWMKMLIKHLFRSFDIVVVNCNVPIEESARRIKERNKKGDRYNIDDEFRQKKLLEIKQKNIEYIMQYFNGTTYQMDMSNEPSLNAVALTKILEENS